MVDACVLKENLKEIRFFSSKHSRERGSGGPRNNRERDLRKPQGAGPLSRNPVPWT